MKSDMKDIMSGRCIIYYGLIRVYYLVRCSKRIGWGLVMIFIHLLKNKNKKNKKRGGDEE